MSILLVRLHKCPADIHHLQQYFATNAIQKLVKGKTKIYLYTDSSKPCAIQSWLHRHTTDDPCCHSNKVMIKSLGHKWECAGHTEIALNHFKFVILQIKAQLW